MLKPRSEASSLGIKKINSPDEFWPAVETLGDRQSYYVLEQYIPGNVFHVDSIVSEKEAVFAEVHGYAKPPFDVMHGGGIFVTRTLPRDSEDVQALRALNQQLLESLGFVRGVTHAEFIKGQEDGQFYFLECAARVGGANIAELVEASTGVNLWAQWANIEICGEDVPYELPPVPIGLRRPHRVARQAGMARSLRLHRSRNRVAHEAPESRRLDRSLR